MSLQKCISPVSDKGFKSDMVFLGIIPGQKVQVFKGVRLFQNSFVGEDWDKLVRGCWIEFDVDLSHKAPKAKNAKLVQPTDEEKFARLRVIYKYSGQENNIDIYRTDGLTSKEAIEFRGTAISYEEFYFGMSENGLKIAAKRKGIQYVPGYKRTIAAELARVNHENPLVNRPEGKKRSSSVQLKPITSLRFEEGDIVVDASRYTSEIYGPVEWQGCINHQGKWKMCTKSSLYDLGTNNIGEFLAIIEALMAKKTGELSFNALYSDSQTALVWLASGRANPKSPEKISSELLEACDDARVWLNENSEWVQGLCSDGLIRQWNTKEWGENPADFGRK